jgi:hypothetical protein
VNDPGWNTKDQIEFWKSRFEHYDNQARGQVDRIVQVALVMVTLVLTISGVFLSQHVPQALLAAPLALAVLLVIVIRLLHEQLFSVILKSYAEGKMAALIEKENHDQSAFLAWSRYADPKLERSFQNALMVTVLTLVAIAVDVVSFVIVFSSMPKPVPRGWTPWIWAEVCLVVGITIVSILAMQANTRQIAAGLAEVKMQLSSQQSSASTT